METPGSALRLFLFSIIKQGVLVPFLPILLVRGASHKVWEPSILLPTTIVSILDTIPTVEGTTIVIHVAFVDNINKGQYRASLSADCQHNVSI